MKNVKSFYDLDYLIELGEQRAELYRAAYQVTLGRLTNIIFVYSAIGIFLIPIIQDIQIISALVFRLAVVVLFMMLICSVINTIRFLIPARIAYPKMSNEYFENLRVKYEKEFIGPDMKQQQIIEARDKIDRLIKASYIDELTREQYKNQAVLYKKSSLFFYAIIWALLAVGPYTLCLGYHITKGANNAEKVASELKGKQ